MVEAESGSITIDGVDISTLGLRHLRSQMSIIPQVGATGMPQLHRYSCKADGWPCCPAPPWLHTHM